MKTIKIDLTEGSIDKAIQELNDYAKDLDRRAKLLCERLASYGATGASIGFARAVYTGDKDFDITVEETENGYRILAEGETVLFLEFGAGVRYGYGHPKADELGYGPGTYPGKGHWNDPNGWWLPKEKGGGHTYGNPPNMPMYNTAKEIEGEILRVAREVFKA